MGDSCVVRNYEGTNRPADMDPDAWNFLDKRHKQIVKDNFLKYGRAFPTDVGIANAAPCRLFIEIKRWTSNCFRIRLVRHKKMNLCMFMSVPMEAHTSLHHMVCRRWRPTLTTRDNAPSLREAPVIMMLLRITPCNCIDPSAFRTAWRS